MKVYDIVRLSGEIFADRPAIIDSLGVVTFSELYQQTELIRTQLKGLGVGHGQSIGIMGKNSRNFIICALAASGCGATVLPISNKLKKYELQQLIEQTSLSEVIHDLNIGYLNTEKTISTAGCDNPDMAIFQTGLIPDGRFLDFIDDVAFVRFSSGTTGKAKGVALTHQAIVERTASANRGLQLDHNDTVLWVLPMAFHFFVSIILYIRFGVTIAICPESYPELILQWVNDHKATMLYAAPLHYRMLIGKTCHAKFDTLKLAISTSAGIDAQISRAFYEKYNIPVTQAYGIIEVGLPFINLDDPISRPSSIGKPLADYEAVILDDDFRPVSCGETGQLAVRGPGMFAAYLCPPISRKDILKNGWFLTGDLAWQDEMGFITISGRCKSMMNISGNKVFPEEVEAVINDFPGIVSSKVFPKPHKKFGEIVHADITLEASSCNIDIEQVIDFCREKLASFKVPQSMSIVAQIEHTQSGKIKR